VRNANLVWIATSAVLLAGFAALVWLKRGEQQSIAMTQISSLQKTSPSPDPVQIVNGASITQRPSVSQQPSSQTTQTYESEMVKRFLTSENLSEFVEYAKRHPEQGGIYMARHAFGLCADAHKKWSGENIGKAVSAVQAKAIGVFQARCEGLAQIADGFADPLAFADSLDRFGAERDPLRTAEKRLTEGRFKGSSNLDLKADLEVLLRNGGVVPKFDHLAALSGPSSTHYLYGSRYVGADEDALTGAWVAYMLERSMLASKDELGGNEALAFCVTSGGICNGPAVDRVTAGLAPPVAEKVRSIYPQLKKALDTADVEAFTPPRR
jgi:hypothetical protein